MEELPGCTVRWKKACAKEHRVISFMEEINGYKKIYMYLSVQLGNKNYRKNKPEIYYVQSKLGKKDGKMEME